MYDVNIDYSSPKSKDVNDLLENSCTEVSSKHPRIFSQSLNGFPHIQGRKTWPGTDEDDTLCEDKILYFLATTSCMKL